MDSSYESLDKRMGLNGKTSQGKLLVMWLDNFVPLSPITFLSI